MTVLTYSCSYVQVNECEKSTKVALLTSIRAKVSILAGCRSGSRVGMGE